MRRRTGTAARTVVAIAMAIGCGGEQDDEVTAEQTPCQRLREHVIDLQLADAKQVDLDAHRAAMKQALGDEFLVSCATLPPAALACALDAPDVTAAAACGTRNPTPRGDAEGRNLP